MSSKLSYMLYSLFAILYKFTCLEEKEMIALICGVIVAGALRYATLRANGSGKIQRICGRANVI
jgi:hypothetical protein